MCNIRIIPQDPGGGPGGSYVSIEFYAGTVVGQGTVWGTVTKMDTAHVDTRVDLSFESEDLASILQYRAEFYSLDDDIEETPVLEYVWVTYLPRTRILYWREN